MILYIGPGLGGGALALLIGFILTLFSFIVSIFWIPLKRLFRYIFKKNKNKG
jgi:hypothetical protein